MQPLRTERLKPYLGRYFGPLEQKNRCISIFNIPFRPRRLFRRREFLELVPGRDRVVLSHPAAWATAAVLDIMRDHEV